MQDSDYSTCTVTVRLVGQTCVSAGGVSVLGPTEQGGAVHPRLRSATSDVAGPPAGVDVAG